MTQTATQNNGHNGKNSAYAQGGRTSKIERYGWSSSTGPGTLMWINKSDIKIDYTYQRNANEAKVIEIAREFSWLAFCAIPVVRRPDGLFAVDGQHRLMAALRRADVTDVPCVVFDSDGTKSEAQGFLDANGKRKPVTAIDKFKARLVTGDEAATFVRTLVESSGRSVDKTVGGKSVRCIYKIQQLATEDRDALNRIWPIAIEICEGQNFQEKLLDALFYIETHMPEGESLNDKRWRPRLVRAGYRPISSAMAASAAFFARGGARVFAEGILKILNKNVKEENHLVLVKD